MPTSTLWKVSTVIATAGLMSTSYAQILGSVWQLRVIDMQQKVRVEAQIQFTDETETGSCMAGHWNRAVVEKQILNDEKFFPLTQPLAYEIEGGGISLGRVTICDGYYFLGGKFENKVIDGVYVVPGRVISAPSEQLGSFSLTKIR